MDENMLFVGGPAAVVLNGRLVTVGVTSFGAAAGCTLGYPAVFARVSYFVDWIASKSGVGC
jgi:chymotrypsin